MYQDENCFEPASDEKFLIHSCYANYWNNASVAFSLNVVSLEVPRRIAMDLYSDNCHTLITERYLYEEQCEQFFGEYHGTFTIHTRTNCYGANCQTVPVATQSFYETQSCGGAEIMYKDFPVSEMPPSVRQRFGEVKTVGMPGYEDSTDSNYYD